MKVRDAGILLSGAKFTLQTVDIDDISVQYDDVADAISHLRVCSQIVLPLLVPFHRG